MLLEILWNDLTTPADLRDGRVRVGGGPDDDLRLEGLPHGLLTLTIEGPRVLVTATRSVRIGAALFPARVPRLLVEGEELRLPNDVVLRRPVDVARRDSRKLVDTAAVARDLLAAADFAVEQTRAATLTCLTGHDQGVVFPLAFSECVLGRADEADVRLRDRAASRRHAVLSRQGNRWLLRPLEATNGLFLNGLSVKAEREVTNGDVLELGQSMLRFDGPARAPGEQTAVDPAPPVAPPPLPTRRPRPVPSPGAPQTRSVTTARLPTRRRGPRVPSEVALMSVGAVLALVGAAVTAFALR
jgi:hypothetical protein